MKNYLKTVTEFAILKAKESIADGEIPVCAVIFCPKTKNIISYATNRTEQDKDPTAHAEILAIQAATKALCKTRLTGYDMFVTLEPCPMCATAISFARINRLYYGAYDVKAGGVDHGCRIFENAPNIYKPEVYSGIEETKCSELLTSFFKTLRKEKQ